MSDRLPPGPQRPAASKPSTSRGGLGLCSGLTAAILCALGLVAGCSGGARKSYSPPVPVLVAPVVRKTVPEQINVIGTVQAYSTVSITPQVGGEIMQVYFKPGQDVKQGQMLLTIDPRPFEAALAQAKANLARDQAQALQAKTDEARYAYLLKNGIGTQEQYDQARATADADTATVAADRAAIRTAALNLQYAHIRSPINGRTGDLLVKRGNVIKANPDNALLVINQIKPIFVQFSVPEKDLAQVRQDMSEHPLTVLATIPSAPQVKEEGLLSFVDNTVNTTTGTVTLKGLFANQDEVLWPGQFVNVTLTLGERADTILVPSQAVQNGQQGTFVFVVDKRMKAETRNVVAGATINGDTVIKQGLSPGEKVVTDGQLRLSPGATVMIKKGLEASVGAGS